MILEWLPTTVLWLLYLTLPILIGVVTILIIYARWYYGILENTEGLTGIVKPFFVGGSDPFFYKKIVLEEDIEMVKRHGSIIGFYEGRHPQIFISDPELISLIFIKHFDHFHNKRSEDAGHPLVNDMMDLLPYDKWKVVRGSLSPQLTTGKIRNMSYQMIDAINDWMHKIHAKAENNGSYEFIAKDLFTALTTDVIARCAFATKINAFDDPNNIFVKYVKKLGLEDTEIGPMASVVLTLPFLAKLEPFFPPEVMDYFGNLLKNILKIRRNSTQEKVHDFVDVMNEMIDKCETPEYKKLTITENTVLSQALVFLIAGFETTSTTLTLLSYRLSQDDKVQDKLLDEIDSYLEKHDGKIEHETIGELVYLTACINETLRMHSPGVRVERVCEKDWAHESSGLKVKKGMVIQVPVYAVHLDEKNYPKPYEFQPERFLPENKNKLVPYAFLPFGLGPHNCIGMRFAKEEIIMAMVNILRDYRIEACEDTKLTLLPGRMFINTYEPFHLKISKRK